MKFVLVSLQRSRVVVALAGDKTERHEEQRPFNYARG